MAAVPITISGVIYPKAKGGSVPQPYPAVMVGYAWRSDVAVDISPPAAPPGTPAHPIVLPPAPPIDGSPPHPEHPIVLPEPPTQPPEIPTDPGMVKPPPPEGGWGWSPVYGWGYFPGSGGSAGPKR
jgi:hypothetical protein